MCSVSPTQELLRELAQCVAEAPDGSHEARAIADFLRAREDAVGAQADDTDPSPVCWKHSVVPMAIVRCAASLKKESLRRFLTRQAAAASTSHHFSVVLAPPVKPDNPARRKMRARIKRIDAAVETALYNSMLLSGADAGGSDTLRGITLSEGGDSQTSTTDRVTLRGAIGTYQCHGAEQRARQQPETFSLIMRDVSIGLDIRLMSLAGGIVGYVLCASRSLPAEHCIIGAAIGAVSMLFVDAMLLIIRMGRDDKTIKSLDALLPALPPDAKAQPPPVTPRPALPKQD